MNMHVHRLKTRFHILENCNYGRVYELTWKELQL